MRDDLEFMTADAAEAYTKAFETSVPLHAVKSTSFSLSDPNAADYLRGGSSTSSGVDVDLAAALRVNAVLACVRVIAEDVAKLPLHLKHYTRDEKGREVTTDEDYHAAMVLLREPNPYMTPQQFLEMMTFIAAINGTAYALKMWVRDDRRGGDETLEELWPLLPGQCHPRHDLWERERELWFDVWTTAEGPQTVPAADLVRISGPSINGFEGLDMVRMGAETIGLSTAIIKAQGKFYKNGQRPSGVLTSDQPLGKSTSGGDIREQLSNQWAKVASGGGTAVLDNGFKYEVIDIDNVDADTIKLHEAMIAEACRIFRVSPSKVMQAAGSVSYNSLEQTNQNHLTDSLEPWLIRWEQGLARDLLTPTERLGTKRSGRFAFFFDREEYLRPLPKDLMEVDVKAIQTGIMTRNEVRERRDLPRFQDPRADDLFAPLATNPGGNPATSAKPKTPTDLTSTEPQDDANARPPPN